jgi:hypothetical protein
MNQPASTPDPMRVLEVSQHADALANYLAAEVGADDLDAMAVLDALASLGLTLRAATGGDRDAVTAAYMSQHNPFVDDDRFDAA